MCERAAGDLSINDNWASSFWDERKVVRPGFQGGLNPRLELEVLVLVVVLFVLVPLYVYPRNPPMRPRMRPMKFIDITEKTSTSMLPSFL